MEKNPYKIVVDTNVFISSLLFGGKPRTIIKLIQENKLTAFTTPMLIGELLDILTKKFKFTSDKITLVEEVIKENFVIVHPSQTLHAVRDEDDNRVLEAAIEAECNYVVTGDKDLLDLHTFKNVVIVKPEEFLLIMQN